MWEGETSRKEQIEHYGPILVFEGTYTRGSCRRKRPHSFTSEEKGILARGEFQHGKEITSRGEMMSVGAALKIQSPKGRKNIRRGGKRPRGGGRISRKLSAEIGNLGIVNPGGKRSRSRKREEPSEEQEDGHRTKGKDRGSRKRGLTPRKKSLNRAGREKGKEQRSE